MKRCDQRKLLERIAFCFSDIFGLVHLLQNDIAASSATFCLAMQNGIIIGRILAHTDQNGCLLYLQISRLLTEVGISRRLDPNGIVQEVEVVEIHGDDLFLRIKTLQLHGDNPLDRFLEEASEFGLRTRRIKEFGQLLGNGTTPSTAFLIEDTAFDHGSEQTFAVYSRMLTEADILRSDESLDQIG